MRVSFGTALIASIVVVFTAIVAILSSKRYLEFSRPLVILYFTSNGLFYSLFSCATAKITIEGVADLLILVSLSISFQLICFGNFLSQTIKNCEQMNFVRILLYFKGFGVFALVKVCCELDLHCILKIALNYEVTPEVT